MKSERQNSVEKNSVKDATRPCLTGRLSGAAVTNDSVFFFVAKSSEFPLEMVFFFLKREAFEGSFFFSPFRINRRRFIGSDRWENSEKSLSSSE